MRPADPGQLRSAWLSSGRFDQVRSAEISSGGSTHGTRFASVLATTAHTKPTISADLSFWHRQHPPTRGSGACLDGEDRPCPQMHVSALRLRGHKHVAATARPLRPGRRTDERSTMSTTAKKRKQQKNQGFTAEEKAAMRARARELKAAEDGERAVRAALAAMAPHDRAIGKRLHALVKESAPDLSPKTWYGMPAYANKDGKVVCFFRNATKFKERYAMFGFNDSAKLDDGSMWPIAFALKKLTKADEARIAKLVKEAVG